MYFQPEDDQGNVETGFILDFLMIFINDKMFDELRTK